MLKIVQFLQKQEMPIDEYLYTNGNWYLYPDEAMAMNTVYLLLGSNLGDKQELIIRAANSIVEQIGTVVNQSAFYETEAWGFETDTTFYNRVLQVATSLSAEEVLTRCLYIETLLGRTRNHPGYASRTIDIDILFYNDCIVQTPHLQIPHPRLHLRRFCLEPLCEIAPHKVHPLLHQSMEELLANCTDTGWVKKAV